MLLLAAGVAGTGALATAQARRPTPLAVLIQQARAGSASAQFILGTRYYSGQEGLPKSLAQAVEWWQRAAAQGYADAECSLGVAYSTGEGGLPKSDGQAVKWWKKAAAQGNALAEDNLGDSYHNGLGGLPKSDGQAVKWWGKAAAQGYVPAEDDIGVMYERGGGGLPKSDGRAVKWWEKAAAQGYAPAIAQLRWLRNEQREVLGQSGPRAGEAAVVHSARAAPAAPPPDHQRLVRSLQSFWALYFRASDAQVVDFGAPALVRPVSFGSGS